MWSSIISGISSVVSKPLETWQRRKLLKEESRAELEKIEAETTKTIAMARLEMAKNGQQQDYDLDRIATENMNNSFKDELILIIFLTPMVLAFVPGMKQHIQAGFEVIEFMPSWYVALIVGMVVVIYGMRGMLKAYMTRTSVKKMGNVNNENT